MKRLYLLVLLLATFNIGNSQNTVNDYSYVVVPESYDFLSEPDQFQLNSLTKFLFNKHGFNAFFPTELPNVKRCDGLYAEVEGKPGLIYTRITVILKDCYGSEVFRSEEGTSKRKEFKRAFQESLREAFESVERLGAKQKDMETYTDLVMDEEKTDVPPVINEMQPPPKNDGTVGEMTVGTGTKIGTKLPPVVGPPDERFSSFTRDGKSFLLRKTATGYSFYEETEDSVTGLTLLGKITGERTELIYTDVDGGSFKVGFNENHDMIIQSSEGLEIYTKTQ